MSNQISVQCIEQLRHDLSSLPKIDPPAKTNVNKREAIKMLKREILSLQAKNYSLEMICELLCRGGIQIKSSTIKSYMKEEKPRTSRKIMANTEQKL